MLKKHEKSNTSCAGQVMTEYIIMLAIIALIALSCLVLFSTFSEHNSNVRQQVGVDMP